MSAYSDKILADGATNYWRLNETSGVTAVDLVGAKNGTLSGGVTLNQAGALTDGDKAMTFDGTTGQIAVTGLVMSMPRTIEAWLQPGILGAERVIVSTRHAVAITDRFVLLHTPTGVLRIYVDAMGAYCAGVRVVTNTQFHHLALVVAGGTLTLFIDGTAEPLTPTATIGAFNPAVMMVGADPSGGGINWLGQLDELAVYPRALTGADAAAHYTLGTAPLTAPLPRDYNTVLNAFLPGTGDLTTRINPYLATLTGDYTARWKQMEKNAGL